MFLNMIAVFYLNQRDVRAIYLPSSTMTLSDADLGLLRRFEPILRFTNGELFFPMATGPFVETCDLLEGPTLREAKVVVPAGALDLERLGARRTTRRPVTRSTCASCPKPMNAVELESLARPAGRARCSTRRAGSPGSAWPLASSTPGS